MDNVKFFNAEHFNNDLFGLHNDLNNNDDGYISNNDSSNSNDSNNTNATLLMAVLMIM